MGPQVLRMLSCRGCGVAMVDCMLSYRRGLLWWTRLGVAYVIRGRTSSTATEDLQPSPQPSVLCESREVLCDHIGWRAALMMEGLARRL